MTKVFQMMQMIRSFLLFFCLAGMASAQSLPRQNSEPLPPTGQQARQFRRLSPIFSSIGHHRIHPALDVSQTGGIEINAIGVAAQGGDRLR